MYNMRETAEALGKSYFTLRRWVSDGTIPPAAYKDTARNTVQYLAEEVQAMGDVLRKHEKDYDYLAASHTTTIHEIWQAVEAIRRDYDGRRS